MSRLVVALAVVSTLSLSTAAVAEELVDGAPAPAEALAAPAPDPAPETTGVVEPGALESAARELSWGGIGVRVGFMSLSAKAEDVPVFGSDITDNRKIANQYIATFNAAVMEYNANRPDGAPAIEPVKEYGSDALDLDATLVQIIPTFHMGGDGYFFRLDVPIGFGDGVTAFGLGLYPINYGYYVESIGLFPYFSLGTVLNYASASSYSGANGDVDVSQVGGIIQGRVALGAKYAFHEAFSGTLELGFTPWGFAGLLDSDKADAISKQGDLDEADAAAILASRPVDPGSAIRGGAISSALDLSVGVEWL